jgi:hypothetical protein
MGMRAAKAQTWPLAAVRARGCERPKFPLSVFFRMDCARLLADDSAAADCTHAPRSRLHDRLRAFGSQPVLAEDAMFDRFECQCIYVEITNERHPRSGRVEYRAKSCAVCQARAALKRADKSAIVAFDSSAPRYQRVH